MNDAAEQRGRSMMQMRDRGRESNKTFKKTPIVCDPCIMSNEYTFEQFKNTTSETKLKWSEPKKVGGLRFG